MGVVCINQSPLAINVLSMVFLEKQVIRVKKTRGAGCTRITCTSFLGLEEPSLKLLRSSELQHTNSSPISNCRLSKSAIFISRNIKYDINSLLLLHI